MLWAKLAEKAHGGKEITNSTPSPPEGNGPEYVCVRL